MKRDVDIREISDGRTYRENDMVKADCGGCKGCSLCCRDMVDTIILDPLDIWNLTTHLDTTFEAMLDNQMMLDMYDGLILPRLKPAKATGGCPFLDREERCSVHPFRPGFCRIFPLGRYYEDGDYTYILQTRECPRPKTKIRVKKWIDIPDLAANHQYICQWHELQQEMQNRLADCEEVLQRNLTLHFLKIFYLEPYTKEDFYLQFQKRRAKILSLLR